MIKRGKVQVPTLNKNKNKGCFSGIIGTVFVVLGVATYAVISSLFNRVFVSSAHGDTVACALMTKWLTGVGIAFILYEAIFILWQFDILKKNKSSDNNTKGKKIFLIVASACIATSLLVGVVLANIYVDCREDSISNVCFVTTKEYRWDTRNDVLRYSLSCDENGGLSFKITMKDGNIVDLFGHVTSISDSFREKYNADKVSLLSYAAYLSEQFDNSGFVIEKEISGVEHMTKAYKDKNPEIWTELERIIGNTSNNQQ